MNAPSQSLASAERSCMAAVRSTGFVRHSALYLPVQCKRRMNSITRGRHAAACMACFGYPFFLYRNIQ